MTNDASSNEATLYNIWPTVARDGCETKCSAGLWQTQMAPRQKAKTAATQPVRAQLNARLHARAALQSAWPNRCSNVRRPFSRCCADCAAKSNDAARHEFVNAHASSHLTALHHGAATGKRACNECNALDPCSSSCGRGLRGAVETTERRLHKESHEELCRASRAPRHAGLD